MFKWFANRKLKYINTFALTSLPPGGVSAEERKQKSWGEIINVVNCMREGMRTLEILQSTYEKIPYKELNYTLEAAGYEICASSGRPFLKEDYDNGYYLYIKRKEM